jgi:hypothetical protein
MKHRCGYCWRDGPNHWYAYPAPYRHLLRELAGLIRAFGDLFRAQVIRAPVQYDPGRDAWNLDGTTFSGELIRALGQQGPTPSPWMRVIKREDGTVTIETKPGEDR